jgi:hypothetical protein
MYIYKTPVVIREEYTIYIELDIALLVYVDKANTKLKKFTELNGCTLVEERDTAYIYRVEEI